MSPGEWKGNNVPDANRILVLGESHYGDEDKVGEPVPYSTSDVIREYLSHRCADGGSARWDRFFDRIAESFGYPRDDSKSFYEKIWFGNYVPVSCGTGVNNTAEYYMKQNRTEYNDSLFSFVNQNNISILICFSKAVYWNLPSAESDNDNSREIEISQIGGRKNTINVYQYSAGVHHGFCNIVLDAPLMVYGIRHPSSRGGFDPKPVYEVLLEDDTVKSYCFMK